MQEDTLHFTRPIYQTLGYGSKIKAANTALLLLFFLTALLFETCPRRFRCTTYWTGANFTSARRLSMCALTVVAVLRVFKVLFCTGSRAHREIARLPSGLCVCVWVVLICV